MQVNDFSRRFKEKSCFEPGDHKLTAKVSGLIKDQLWEDTAESSFRVKSTVAPAEEPTGTKVYGSWKVWSAHPVAWKGDPKRYVLTGNMYNVKTLKISESDGGLELLVNGMTAESWLRQGHWAANQGPVQVKCGKGSVSDSADSFVYSCDVDEAVRLWGQEWTTRRYRVIYEGITCENDLKFSLTLEQFSPALIAGLAMTVHYRARRI